MNMRVVALFGIIIVGCDGAAGTDGKNGRDGVSATVSAEPAGANCAAGGVKVQTGTQSASYICNGASGSDGANGQSATVSSEAAGGNCPTGGVKVQVADAAATFVCNGSDGALGQSATVSTEAAGANCPSAGVKVQVGDGTPAYICNGPAGADGTSASVATELPGLNCPAGGLAMHVGSSAVTYVCNGVAGASASLTAEPPGLICSAGGVKIQVGSGDPTYVCNGRDGDAGVDGVNASVTSEGPGSNCPAGGVKVQVGSGAPAYVCNGLNGDAGTPGTPGTPGTAGAGAVITTEAPGVNCATGGVRIQVGIASPTYVCNGLGGDVSAPAFSMPAGSYEGSVTVALTSSSPSATIYYTTNGSTPSSASTLYSAPLVLSTATTVKAIALVTGRIDSPISSATYQIISVLRVATTGNDITGTGTAAAPFATMNAAAAAAASLTGSVELRVAAGAYTLAATVTVPARTSILAGYTTADWNTRDAVANMVTVNASSIYVAFSLQSGAVKADGLRVTTTQAGSAQSVVCFSVNTPATLSNNTCSITAGGNTGATGVLLSSNAGAAIIDGNTITIAPGAGTNSSVYGIASSAQSPTFRNNVIRASYTGRYLYGLLQNAGSGVANILIINNVIDATSPTSLVNGGSNLVIATQPLGSTVRIANNSIRGGVAGGNGFTHYALSVGAVTTGRTISVDNNIFFSRNQSSTSNACIDNGALTSLKNNNFFDCGSYMISGAPALTDVNALANASGNINFDLVDGSNTYFVDEATDWRLKAGGTVGFLTAKTGGLDLSSIFTTDLLGVTRTASSGLGWSMGAYEQDL